MALQVTPLISRNDLTDYIEIRAGFTGKDNLLDGLILTATRQIETATRRSFTKQSRVEILDTKKSVDVFYDFSGDYDSGDYTSIKEQVITLKGVPIDNTLNDFRLYYDLERVWASTSVINSSDYYRDDENSLIYLKYPTSSARLSLKAVYTAGYAVTAATNVLPANLSAAIPSDLKLACIYQVMWLYNKRFPETMNVTQDSLDGAASARNFTKPIAGIVPDAWNLLSPYRNIMLGRR